MAKVKNIPPIKEKYIETPEKLLSFWEEYKQWTNSNPIRVQDFVGKDGDEVYRLRQRPLTLERFQTRIRSLHGFTIMHYFENTLGAYNAYSAVCSHIKEERRADHIEGGMAGIYNPSITQRLNNITETIKNENTNKNFDVTLDLK